MSKILLCIFDGLGISNIKDPYNPLQYAYFFNNLLKSKFVSFLDASGESVGLPIGQMGNSEVGHMTIGLGKTILQDLPRINKMIESGELFDSIESKLKSNTIHIWGLFSNGGVHAHKDHIIACIKFLISKGKTINLHIVLDGRDTPAKSAINDIKELESLDLNIIKTITGRYFSMDRDNRVDRTKAATDTVIYAKADYIFDCPFEYVNYCYNNDITDEFVPPAINYTYKGVSSNDSLLIMNYRQDRVRQFLDSSKDKFENILGMSNYGIENIPYILQKENHIEGLGHIISSHNMKQLRIAETEKYAHVTYFFNGGYEKQLEGEDRIIIPSPKVATYDLKPEMSSFEITDSLINAMNQNKYDLIVANYALLDMVGHTGNFEASVKAVKAFDLCLKKLYESSNYEIIITSDHGNIECMKDKDLNPITSHSFSKVPFICNYPVRKNGALFDIAPTISQMFGLKEKFDGKSLLT